MVQGVKYANSRFTFESWKSKVTNPKNHSYAENRSKPKKPQQTQLWKTRHSAAESRAKLDV